MSEPAPSYELAVHSRARAEIDALATEYDTEDLKDRIRGAATCRQPKTHPAVGQVEKYDELLRVRGGGIRALVAFEPPHLVLLVVGKRPGFYKRAPKTAMDRLREWRAFGEAGD